MSLNALPCCTGAAQHFRRVAGPLPPPSITILVHPLVLVVIIGTVMGIVIVNMSTKQGDPHWTSAARLSELRGANSCGGLSEDGHE